MLSPELASELRVARPVASRELRERVREVAASERPAREPRFALPSFRRLALVAIPPALAVARGGAVAQGLTGPAWGGRRAAPPPARSAWGAPGIKPPPIQGPPVAQADRAQPVSPVPPNSSARLQQYGAF